MNTYDYFGTETEGKMDETDEKIEKFNRVFEHTNRELHESSRTEKYHI